MKGRRFVNCEVSWEEPRRARRCGWGSRSPTGAWMDRARRLLATASCMTMLAMRVAREAWLGETFFVVERIAKKGREGNSCLLTVRSKPPAGPLHISRCANWRWGPHVFFDLRGAKETFQLIANIYKSGDSTWKPGWEIGGSGSTRPILLAASTAGVTDSCPPLMRHPLSSRL